MKRVCFYHQGCPDGFGAAWAVRRVWGDDARFLARSHDDPLPLETLEGALVVFVDITVDNAALLEVANTADHVIVLDHHLSAQLRYSGDLSVVNRIEDGGHEVCFDLDHSGAVLAWQYFHPDTPTPAILHYVEDQDLWNWKLADSEQVNAAIASYARDFETWDELAARGIEELVREGEPIVRANKMEVQRAIRNPDTLHIDGQPIEAVNASVNRSAIGHELAQRRTYEQPWSCVYRINRGQVHATLYSIGDLDVSKIATSLGGGGHRNASGFSMSLAEWHEKIC